MSKIRTPLIMALIAIAQLLHAESGSMRQGYDSIQLGGARSKATGELKELIEELQVIDRKVSLLPDLSGEQPSRQIIERHAALLEAQAQRLISIRHKSDRIADQLMTIKAKGTFPSPDEHIFLLEDAIIKMRLQALAADERLTTTREIAVHNHQALKSKRTYAQFTLAAGRKVPVRSSKIASRTLR